MLQFDPEVFNAPLCNEDISASFLQSEVGRSLRLLVAWNFSISRVPLVMGSNFFVSHVPVIIYSHASSVAHLIYFNNGATCYLCL